MKENTTAAEQGLGEMWWDRFFSLYLLATKFGLQQGKYGSELQQSRSLL